MPWHPDAGPARRWAGGPLHGQGRGARLGLFLLADTPLAEGDWVLVSTGNAVQKLTAQEAASVWALLDEMLDLDEEAARA